MWKVVMPSFKKKDILTAYRLIIELCIRIMGRCCAVICARCTRMERNLFTNNIRNFQYMRQHLPASELCHSSAGLFSLTPDRRTSIRVLSICCGRKKNTHFGQKAPSGSKKKKANFDESRLTEEGGGGCWSQRAIQTCLGRVSLPRTLLCDHERCNGGYCETTKHEQQQNETQWNWLIGLFKKKKKKMYVSGRYRGHENAPAGLSVPSENEKKINVLTFV